MFPAIMLLSSSSVEVVTTNATSNNFNTAIMEVLTSSPYLLVVVLIAYIIGHLWTFVILTYISKMGRKILMSQYGKLGLGITWLAIVSIPFHIVVYGNIRVTLETLSTMWPPVLIIALAIQFVVIILVSIIHKKR